MMERWNGWKRDAREDELIWGGPSFLPPATARQTQAAGKIILSRRQRTNKRGDCQEVMTLLVFRPRAPGHDKKLK